MLGPRIAAPAKPDAPPHALQVLEGVNDECHTWRGHLDKHGGLNRALHSIVVARLRDELTTGAYAIRRRAEGKSVREIRRWLKREVSR